MRLTQILMSSAILLIAAPAMAQMAAPVVNKDPAAQPAGVYKMDPRHTSVTWKVMHMGVSDYTARFSKADGELTFDPKDVTKSSVKVSIPTDSVSTGDPKFDEEIAGDKFLGKAKTPNITFVSTSITKTGADTGTVTGNLTLNGVTKPVTLDTKFYGGIDHPMMPGRDLGFSATTTIKRSEFKVMYGIPLVGDEVKISIETEFMLAAAHGAATPAAPTSTTTNPAAVTPPDSSSSK